jgi:DNA-binding protein H-NS
MVSIDLSNLTLSELKQLQKDAQRAIEGLADRKKQVAMSALEAHAQELGFSLSDLLGTSKTRKSSGASGPKYRHPENQEVTWSGRGRKPGWFIDALAAGTTPEALAV